MILYYIIFIKYFMYLCDFPSVFQGGKLSYFPSVEKLPPSSSYTLILVIVDRLSKQSLFIPTYDVSTTCTTIHPSHLLKAWSSQPRNFRLQHGICFPFSSSHSE